MTLWGFKSTRPENGTDAWSELSATVSRSSAAKLVGWSVIENAGLALVSVGSLVVYTRYLSPSDFGLFSIVLALIELLGLLVTMPFHDALVQRPGIGRLHFDTAFTVTMGISVVLFAGCALFAPSFARWVNYPAAASVLTAMALYFPFAAIGGTIVPLHRRRLEFRPLAVRSLVGRVSGAMVGMVFVILGAGLWGLVVQYVLIALVSSLALWFMSSVRPRLRFGTSEIRSVASFSIYSIGGLFLTFAVGRVFTILVGVALGAKSAGYLNLSFRIVDVLWAIAATAISQAALSVLSRLDSDRARLKRAYGAALELTCLTLYPCFVGIALIAPELIELLFGRAWLVCSGYVAVLALLILVRAPGILGRPLLAAVGRPRDVMIGVGFELLVMLTSIAIFGGSTLPWAMAIWVIRELVPVPVNAYLLKRATGIGYIDQVRGAMSPLLASVCMCVAVLLVRRLLPPVDLVFLRLVLLVVTGIAAYLATVWFSNRLAILRAVEFLRSATVPRAAALHL